MPEHSRGSVVARETEDFWLEVTCILWDVLRLVILNDTFKLVPVFVRLSPVVPIGPEMLARQERPTTAKDAGRGVHCVDGSC